MRLSPSIIDPIADRPVVPYPSRESPHVRLRLLAARAGGYAPRGQRLVAAAPHWHWKTTTLVAGLTARGVIAPMVLDGPMDAAAFIAYVEQVLAREVRRGELVILDNLSAHKTAGVRAALTRCRVAYLYLPQYSPDNNPIENAFSKLKRLVHAAAERTVEGLWAAGHRAVARPVPPGRVPQLPPTLRV